MNEGGCSAGEWGANAVPREVQGEKGRAREGIGARSPSGPTGLQYKWFRPRVQQLVAVRRLRRNCRSAPVIPSERQHHRSRHDVDGSDGGIRHTPIETHRGFGLRRGYRRSPGAPPRPPPRQCRPVRKGGLRVVVAATSVARAWGGLGLRDRCRASVTTLASGETFRDRPCSPRLPSPPGPLSRKRERGRTAPRSGRATGPNSHHGQPVCEGRLRVVVAATSVARPPSISVFRPPAGGRR
jgi:hypothetical protein